MSIHVLLKNFLQEYLSLDIYLGIFIYALQVSFRLPNPIRGAKLNFFYSFFLCVNFLLFYCCILALFN